VKGTGVGDQGSRTATKPENPAPVAVLTDEQQRRYLERIGLSGALPVTARTLAAIQWAHLHTVPFENLDICALDHRFSLEIPDIYDKIVERGRGGFCFELNGLLATLLESMGYEVWRMAAHFSDEAEPDTFDHLILMVTVPCDDSRWYVDVGAGRVNPERPVPIGGATGDGRNRTRFTGGQWVGEAKGEDGWSPVLAWDPDVWQLNDFAPRCAYFQTDPGSFFRSGALCTILVPGGRVTLAKRTLITTIDGRREERALTSADEIGDALQSIFGFLPDEIARLRAAL
jgi:N-hydroxyarylamine O-acetyltransferase